MMTGRPLTIPQCPCHRLYMAWAFRSFAILRTLLSWAANEISKVGGATTTGRLLTIRNTHAMYMAWALRYVAWAICGLGILLVQYPVRTVVLGL